jgi:regulator of chromosome condensation
MIKFTKLYSWGCAECLGRSGLEYTPLPVQFPEPCIIVQVACSESATIALQDTGHVWFWGFFRNEKGSKIGYAKYPKKLELLQDIATISMGESHALCLSSDFVAYSFGVGEYGQLVGKTAHDSHVIPRQIALRASLQIMQSFAVGFHSFWQTAVGLYGCGKNGYGELGVGHTDQISTPVKIPIFSKVIQIAGGLHHILFLDEAGIVWVTGRNSDGQCGIDEEIILIPRQIEYLPPVAMIGCGKSSNHSCIVAIDIDAVDVSGDLWTCGEGVYGQLAHRNSQSLRYFSKAPLKGRKVRQVAGGTHFTIALLTSSFQAS